MGKNQHVVFNSNGGWDIKGENNTKATKHTETKKEAIDIAREIAKNQKSELVIHNKNGQISDKDSFGNDPCPPKDKKH
ncbi:DUF2188 domain-containing protein [Romboutsia ilealis]|uniref:DUF2188 domain-containing protein n=1 Tax=Romboutsia ilealis TaxID=1115758 RepID=UPI00272D7425|nr:DUF2188 domain-containing protein [Romboutsia ilealis]